MRTVGPREISTQPFEDVPIILDWYNKGGGKAKIVVREVSGNLNYASDFMITNPFTDTSPTWIPLTANNLVGVGKYYDVPEAATAVRVRSTAGAGVVRYAVTMSGGG